MAIGKLKEVLGRRIGETRMIPVTIKIVAVFFLIILVSNLTSNWVNLIFNRTELVGLMRQLLVKDLRDINSFANNQHEIYKFNQDRDGSLKALEKKALFELKNKKAVVLAVSPAGKILVQASRLDKKFETFEDAKALSEMRGAGEKGEGEGFIRLRFNNERYFATFKYNAKWDFFILRGEEENEFYQRQRDIFVYIVIIVGVITLASALVGIFLLRHILRFIGVITTSIMDMIRNQKLEIINLKGASSDDITYLGMAFNSLSSTIDNLVNIFQKFTNRDIVVKAYKEREVRLEGVKQDLTILFSDIKSFTFITEQLGTDIIKLLNMHYDASIREIQEKGGIVSAIIGDALLAIFGVEEDGISHGNKSYEAILASYKVQDVARNLRNEMALKKEILQQSGSLSPEDEKIYQAVLLEVGVGLDGGEVFYGTIGSYVRMTNTVIGDNVNAASRLEGLTRVYRAPVICSEYVKDDVEKNMSESPVHFIELDTVQVKGKTTGRKVYLPVPKENYTQRIQREEKIFSEGLQLYYKGDWPAAYEKFRRCHFKFARVFRERTKGAAAPEGWNGIWEMTTK